MNDTEDNRMRNDVLNNFLSFLVVFFIILLREKENKTFIFHQDLFVFKIMFGCFCYIFKKIVVYYTEYIKQFHILKVI